MEIAACQLVGFRDLHYIRHALHLTQMLSQLRINAADQADYRMVRTFRQMSLKALFLDNGDDFLDLFLRCLIGCNYDHLIFLPFRTSLIILVNLNRYFATTLLSFYAFNH
ncbi:hypothetical protein D3C71_1453710 [compost metagenome]